MRSYWWGAAALTIANTIWAGNFLAGAVLGHVFLPWVLGGYRWLIGSALLLGIALWRRERWPHGRDWWYSISLGLIGVTGFTSAIYAALNHLAPSTVAILFASNPILTLVLARTVLKQPSTVQLWLGVALTMVGVIWVVGGGHVMRWNPSTGLGVLYAGLATLSWAVYTLGGEPIIRRSSPWTFTALSAVAGTVAFLPGFLFVRTPIPSGADWLGILYVGILAAGSATGLWFYGVSQVGAKRASLFGNLMPVITPLLAWALLSQQPSWALAAGGGLVLGGVLLTRIPDPGAKRLPADRVTL